MRSLVSEQAAALDLEPVVLATKRDMETVLFAPADAALPERLSGWRRDVIGAPLQALVNSMD